MSASSQIEVSVRLREKVYSAHAKETVWQSLEEK
jgi:hypothetical protein